MSSKRPYCDIEGGYDERYRSRFIYKRRLLHEHVHCTVKTDTSFPRSNEEAGSEVVEENIPKGVLIWRAAKLPIYSVALVPLTVSFSTSMF